MDQTLGWLASDTVVSNWAIAGAGALAAYVGFRAATFVAGELGLFAASDKSTDRKLRVVVTGGSRGIGWSLARQFVELGDSVVITGRNPEALERAAAELAKHCKHGGAIFTARADVASAPAMAAMASEATAVLGGKPDIWLHNAGAAQPENKPLVDTDPADIERVVLTNSLGTLITVRAAMREMAGSPRGGHIFLMDGAGADGMVTANFATYGYTKAGVPQLLGSLKREAKGTGLVIHALSPGMVITDLLLKKEVAKGTAWFFNVLAEMPATVAAWMVPRVRAVAKFPVAVGKEASYSTYSKMLTQTGAIARFLAAPMSSNRLIDTTTGVVKSPGYGCPAKTTIIAAASKSKSE